MVSITEIRIHGRGGQGTVLLSELIALSALYDGTFCRSFPFYGIARRGAPVTAFATIGTPEEMTRSQVYAPDVVIVQDPKLPEVIDVTAGLKEQGTVIQNASKSPRDVAELLKAETKRYQIAVVDATSVALEILGRPLPNTVMLGAFSKATKHVTLNSAVKALKRRFPAAIYEKNIRALRIGYRRVQVESINR